jgi:bile acid:Na+ symporter, BASS family
VTPEKLAVVVFLACFMLLAGLQCDFAELREAFQSPVRLLRIFAANFVIVPILGVIVVRLFALDEFVATGIMLMAISPGVPFLPLIAGTKKGGSAGLATGLAVILPAVSIITVPITMPLVLPADAAAHVTFASFIVNLLLIQLLPLCVGLFIRARSATIAPMLTKLVAIVLVLAAIVVFYYLIPQMGTAFATVYGSHGLIASLLIIVLCAVVGWLLGGKTPEYRVTLSISTVMRNVGLATLIATQAFHDTVAGAVVLAYFVMQFIFANLIGMYYKRREAK